MSHKPAREMVERGTEPDEDTARLLLSTSVDLEQGDGPESGNDSKLAARSAPVESAASKNFMKNISLALLAVQNCAMILSMKYSKSHVAPGDKPYISTTVVVVGEVVKINICLLYILYSKGGFGGLVREINVEMVQKPVDCLKLLIPSLLYTLQNNLQLIAISNISAAVFQVTAQLKILTTAVFSVLILGRALGMEKWGGLAVLTVGCVLVNLDSVGDTRNVNKEGSQVVGLVSTLMGTVTSGLAGVYLEKMLKSSQTTLWIRNIQLGVGGLVIGSIGTYLNDGEKIAADGFFQGYDSWTWIVIALSSGGGILVAVVVKYADNLYKAFAVSISIVLSSLISIPLFNFSISMLFVVGALLVLSSIFLYEKIILFDRLTLTVLGLVGVFAATQLKM